MSHSVSLVIGYVNRILGVHKDEIYNMRNHLRKSPRLRRKENIKNKNKINPEWEILSKNWSASTRIIFAVHLKLKIVTIKIPYLISYIFDGFNDSIDVDSWRWYDS